MAKVVKLFNDQEAEQEALVKHIEETLEMAKAGKLKNILIAAESGEGEVMTGYCNLDLGEKQYMVSHVQVDIHYEVVKANIDQLIEFI